jgi:hypothetical protein
VHVLEVPDPGVRGERLEARRRVGGEPVGHVAAVAAAGGAEARGVDPRVAGERGVEAAHQVGVRLAPPVARHLVHEALAVARGAARVDDHDGHARRRQHLVVPARVPLVEERALRPAVDHEDGGVLPARLPLRRLDHEPLHARAARAGEPELLGRVERQPGEQALVLPRDLARRPAGGARRRVERRRVDLGRRLRGVAQPGDRAAVARHARGGVVVRAATSAGAPAALPSASRVTR